MTGRGFYVMQEIAGDECMVKHTERYGEAAATVADIAARFPDPDLGLSIWSAGAPIVATWTRRHGLRLTPRAIRESLTKDSG